jgi:hypothetical protein
MNGGNMNGISPVGYSHQLASLVALVKSNTEEGNYVMSILQEGNEMQVRNMLMNFGNPTSIEWHHFTMAAPWTEFQINAAVEDLDAMKPPEQVSAKFWAW